MKRSELRSGYTTGACAAAAAKAAVLPLLGLDNAKEVEIPLPDGSRIRFRVQASGTTTKGRTFWASVVKDAGDDPDVTNGAEIRAEAGFKDMEGSKRNDEIAILITGGQGVGKITRPGLPLPIGEPAINPVPRKMIKDAVVEAISEHRAQDAGHRSRKRESADFPPSALPNVGSIEITISVPEGERLAKKTLNSRLGIVGGISILGTTGIVKPLSSEAWTATITAGMDVAKAMGHSEIVLSAGRASEKAHMMRFGFSEECYVMMGDYLEFSVLETERHGFGTVHLCAQWAKMLKIAMATPQTHVRHGAIDIKKAASFLNSLGIDIPREMEFNTAREIFDFITSGFSNTNRVYSIICDAAKKYVLGIAADTKVIIYLVSYEGEIIADSE